MRAITLAVALMTLLFVEGAAPVLSPGLPLAKAQPRDRSKAHSAVAKANCAVDKVFAIAIHGGAIFSRSNQDRKLAFLRATLSDARSALAAGARALDVVEAAITNMEDSGLFNAGKGSIANRVGVIELDASIMEGRLQKAGAVASVKAVRNPISAARLVMERSRHVMMVGVDADRFVQRNGGAMVDTTYFLHGGVNFGDVPLPDDINIVPPSNHIPRDLAAFSGAWGGVWVGSLNHILVVERIRPDGVYLVYALGPGIETGDGFHSRRIASFREERLRLIDANHAGTWLIDYRLNSDATLTATARRQDGKEIYHTKLRRIELARPDNEGGTVGAVVRDRCGDLAAGTSTGGFGSKTPGRVGDSPLIGAGTYANNGTAAISSTGHGELFIRHVVAHAIAAAVRYQGLSIKEAAERLIKRDLFRKGLRGGVIAMDQEGKFATPFNTEGMVRGVTSHSLTPMVAAY